MPQSLPQRNSACLSEFTGQSSLAEQKRLVSLLIQADEDAWRYVLEELLQPYVLSSQTFPLLQKYAIHTDSILSRVYLSLSRNNADALRRFRFDCRLSTYLYYWVKDALAAELRSICKKESKEQVLTHADSLPEEETPFSSVLLREKITETESCLYRLCQEYPLHYCVLVSRTILQKSSKETAELLQRSVAWVDQMLHRAQRHMRVYRKSHKERDSSYYISSLPNIARKAITDFTTPTNRPMNTKIQWSQLPIHKRRTCMLMITHSCNLNCVYCYESYKARRFMPSDIAKKAILDEIQVVKNNEQYEGLEIDFMGGEPMTNFALIKELVEWAETGVIDVPYIFFLTSNGTLFNEERKAWFEEHRNHVVVGISYDGTTEMQNQNRSTGDYAVDRDWFHRIWPQQEFHMTISQETLPHLAEGILELQRKGYPLSASLAQGINWNEQDAIIYEKQLQVLAESYLKEPNLAPINLIGSILYVFSTAEIREMKQKKYCGSGDAMITYDVDGTTYGCHMFTSIVLGKNALKLGNCMNLCKDVCEDEYCRACVLKLVCPTCAGFNYRYRGDISKRDHRWCNMILAQARKAAEFQIKALTSLATDLDAFEISMAENALKAFSVFKKLEKQEAPFIAN